VALRRVDNRFLVGDRDCALLQARTHSEQPSIFRGSTLIPMSRGPLRMTPRSRMVDLILLTRSLVSPPTFSPPVFRCGTNERKHLRGASLEAIFSLSAAFKALH